MARAFGFLIFLVGFAMLFGGIALLIGGIGGDIQFKSGKKIPKLIGRKVALALLAFFPLVFVVRFLVGLVDPDRLLPSPVVYWPLALACLGFAGVWLYNGMKGSQPVRSFTIDPTADTFVEDPAPPTPGPILMELDDKAPPSPAKPGRSKKANPFDFC